MGKVQNILFINKSDFNNILKANEKKNSLSEKKDYRFTVMPRWRLTEI